MIQEFSLRSFLKLVGFSSAVKFDKTGVFSDFRKRQGEFTFLSRQAMKGERIGRKNDLESALYILIRLLYSSLPWEHENQLVAEDMKERLSGRKMLFGMPEEVIMVSNMIFGLALVDVPEYDKYISILTKALETRKLNANLDDFVWNRDKKEWLKKAEGTKSIETRNRLPVFNPPHDPDYKIDNLAFRRARYETFKVSNDDPNPRQIVY